MPPDKPMIEARLTIAPPPRFFIWGWARREQRKSAVRFRSSTASHSSFFTSSAVRRIARPALLTSTSIPPSLAKAFLTCSSSVTSQPVSMSSTSTLAPACSKSFAVAAPMPLAPPVTTAVLPLSESNSLGEERLISPTEKGLAAALRNERHLLQPGAATLAARVDDVQRDHHAGLETPVRGPLLDVPVRKSESVKEDHRRVAIRDAGLAVKLAPLRLQLAWPSPRFHFGNELLGDLRRGTQVALQIGRAHV